MNEQWVTDSYGMPAGTTIGHVHLHRRYRTAADPWGTRVRIVSDSHELEE